MEISRNKVAYRESFKTEKFGTRLYPSVETRGLYAFTW